MNTIKIIELCKDCRGEGDQFDHKITDYHKGESMVVRYKCVSCEGSGRIWVTTTVIKEPYKPNG